MRTARSRNPEATRAALLDAAEAVFLEKGFGNASVSEIAHHAGITKSLVHHYFGSKEGIWQEVKLRRFMAYAEQQMAMLESSRPSVELLRASLAFFFEFLRQNPQVVRIMAWMFVERDEGMCMQKDRELIRTAVEKIRECQRQGLLRADIDPRFVIFVFSGMCHHWFQERDHFLVDYGDAGLPGDLDETYLQSIMKLFFEGVLPR